MFIDIPIISKIFRSASDLTLFGLVKIEIHFAHVDPTVVGMVKPKALYLVYMYCSMLFKRPKITGVILDLTIFCWVI